MSNAVCYLYEFGPFRLDPTERLLLRDGHPIPLTPKAFDLLMVLVQHSGHLVEKRELLEAVWPASFVEEGNLSVMVHALRKAFGSDHRDYTYIETVSKRGYRFAAEVTLIEYAPFAPAPSSPKAPVEPAAPPMRLIPSPAVSPSSSDRVQPPALRMPTARWRRVEGDNRLLLLVLALAPIIATGTLLWMKIVPGNQPAAVASRTALAHSLAVLPFATIGDKSDDIYLGLGISDAVTTKLGNTRKIVIRPTSAMSRYVGAARDPEAAGREQKVDAVLDGRIQRAGDRIRLTVQLIRVSDGAQMWGDTFDEKYTNIFAVEDAVSEQVARSIRLELTGEEQRRLTQRPTENSAAYQAYVKGRYFWNKRTTEGLQKGLEYFQEAVALDSAYTQAYVGIADSYALLGLFNAMSPKEAFPKAKEAASKALEMDPELADAHATLGFVNFYYDWDGLAAENEFRHALRGNPNYAMAHAWYAEDLAAMGRFSEASAEAKRAQEADPVSLTVGAVYGYVANLAGRNDEAIEGFKKAIEIDPAYPRLHFRLGSVYLQKSMYQPALAEFLKAVQLAGGGDRYGDQYYEAALGSAYAVSGNAVEARKVLDTLVRRSKSRYVPAYAIATIYAGLGDRERVFEWLERGYEDRSTSMAYLKVDPILKDFRSDPRFAALAQRIRF
jgi:DNA-binding winged helix-turn-helix (wHTH) protein/TolB-like protein/Flp pilus assembly protein TadD